MPTAQLAPPQSSNGAQPSLTPPSPSFPSGVATTSSNRSADKSKDAGDGGIGTGGSIAIGIILVFLLLGIIGAAGWCIWKRKKKGSGTSGGYILPTTLVSSPKSGTVWVLSNHCCSVLIHVLDAASTIYVSVSSSDLMKCNLNGCANTIQVLPR